MNAHARALFAAIVAFSVALAHAAAQGQPITGQPANPVAASRTDVPFQPAAPIPAPAPVQPQPAPVLLPPVQLQPPPVRTPAPLGGWVSPFAAPAAVPVYITAPAVAPVPGSPAFMPYTPSAIVPAYYFPVGFYASKYFAAMEAQKRPISFEPNYGNFLDRQTPLPRAENAAFARPLTNLLPAIAPFGDTDTAAVGPLYYGGDARGDAVVGTAQLSDPTSFIPSSIPVKGQPTFGLPQAAEVKTGTTIGTRLFLESYVTTEALPATRFFTQLAGTVDSNGSGTGRMPHLFGQLKGLIVGEADTFFSDPRAFPNTIDYAGPNALVYLQHKLIGYLFDIYQGPTAAIEAGLSIEQPEPSVTPPDPQNAGLFTSRSQIPDIAARARVWNPVWGHFQFASIVRSVGIENLEYTTGTGATEIVHPASNQQVLGWGVQCTARLHPFDGMPVIAYDLVGFGGSYGRGITSYFPDFGDSSGLDAVFDDKDQLRALPLSSFFMSYTHLWTERLRSTVVYSQVDLKSFESPDLATSPYRRGRYFAANLICEFDITTAGNDPKQGIAFTGIEYLFGRHELLDGSYGDAHRVQLTAGAKY